MVSITVFSARFQNDMAALSTALIMVPFGSTTFSGRKAPSFGGRRGAIALLKATRAAASPPLRPLFKGDTREQGRKLKTMITLAVKGLDDLPALVPAVKDLGRRHAGYGVTAAHYGTVATALLWTLEKGLGDAFTPPVKAAWTQTYTVLATTMQQA